MRRKDQTIAEILTTIERLERELASLKGLVQQAISEESIGNKIFVDATFLDATDHEIVVDAKIIEDSKPRAKTKGERGSKHNNEQETGQSKRRRRKGKPTTPKPTVKVRNIRVMYTLTFKDREEEWDSDEDLGEEDLPELDESFLEFLRRDPKGPKLSSEMVELISRYGVVNTESLVTLSQYPLEKLLGLFTNREFWNLRHEDVKNLHGYRRYISQHNLITTQGSINLKDFQLILYTLYRKTERQNLSRNFPSIFQT